MLIYLDIKIPHLQIAHLGGNLEVGNIKIHLLNNNFDWCVRPVLSSVSLSSEHQAFFLRVILENGSHN